jgi:acetolactate synthase-1/2/3 large subunit
LSKPVLLAGYGIRLAGLADQFIPYIERLGIPVLTTWKAADLIPDNHPLFFGRPGVIASKYANLIVQNCDYLMVLGARLDCQTVGYNIDRFAPHAHKVIKDDLKELTIPDCFKGDNCDAWIRQCMEWKQRYPLPESWVDEISLFANEGDIIVPSSSGMACEMLLQRFRVKKNQRLIFAPGLGSMGFGLPMAIGAACAEPTKRVICVEGDGSIQQCIPCLQTVKHHNLNIALFVVSNNGYASIRNTQKNNFGRLIGCDPEHGMPYMDPWHLSRMYGVPITEIRINPDTEIRPRMQRKVNADGTITPGRLEDIE